MNQLQQKYVLQRINDIANRLVARARVKYVKKAVNLTGDQKLSFIKSGKMPFDTKKFIRKITTNYSDSLSFPYPDSIFDFSKYESKAKTLPVFHTVCTKINNKADNLKDTLLLGDSDKALKAISKFAEMVI